MRKDPPRNTEVYDPGVILTYELLQIPVHNDCLPTSGRPYLQARLVGNDL